MSGLARVINELRGRAGLPSGQRPSLGAETLPGAAVVLGGIRPTLPSLSLEESAWMLQGLFFVNKAQLARGVPGIDRALKTRPRRVRYIRADRAELWRPIRAIWLAGGGDCEDLAAAVAAELDTAGVPARPVIYRVRPGLAHAVVEILDPRFRALPKGAMLFGHPVIGPGIIDPSRTGGMGQA
jgi:hypothetical protein